MRAFLPSVPICRMGRQIPRSGDRIGDDRSGRRGLSKRRLGMLGGSETACDGLVLVGCGKMGTAMLRGWIAGNAASRFFVVEPEGTPLGFAAGPRVEWHAAADT